MFAESANRNRLAGQDSLFGGSAAEPEAIAYPVLPDYPMESRNERLAMEKEVLGIYVSDHPLRGHESTLRTCSTHTCESIPETEEGTYVKLAGVIAGLRTIITKAKGEKMASVLLEDFTGQAGLTAFPATYAKFKDALIKDTVVQISGYIAHREMRGERTVEIRIDDVKPVQATLEFDRPKVSNAQGFVKISIKRATPTQLQKLRDIIEQNPGSYEVSIEILSEDIPSAIELTHHVAPTTEFRRMIEAQVVSAQVNVQEWNRPEHRN
jgi:DNA polymerase-3 subunit alpha